MERKYPSRKNDTETYFLILQSQLERLEKSSSLEYRNDTQRQIQYEQNLIQTLDTISVLQKRLNQQKKELSRLSKEIRNKQTSI